MGQRRSLMWASNSGPKYLMAEDTGLKPSLPVAAEGAGLHVEADGAHQLHVARFPFQAAQALQHFQQVAHAHAAGETLAAGLVLAEGDEGAGQVDDAGVLVGGDDPTGAEDGAGVAENLEIPAPGRGLSALRTPPRGPPVWTSFSSLPPLTPPPTS